MPFLVLKGIRQVVGWRGAYYFLLTQGLLRLWVEAGRGEK